jgi:hypothetical protein
LRAAGRLPRSRTSVTGAVARLARPAHALYIKVMVYTPDNVAHAGTVLIEPDGAVWAYSLTASDAQQYTSLAGICFPLGS